MTYQTEAKNTNIAAWNTAKIKKANEFALSMKPIIDELRAEGWSYHQMSELLNEMGYWTPKQHFWAYKSVRNLCARLDALATKATLETDDKNRIQPCFDVEGETTLVAHQSDNNDVRCYYCNGC